MRVLFMGTPDFAAVCLERLLKEPDLQLTVVTQPDKPQGRHMTLTPSAVKKAALDGGLPLYQPERLKDGAFEETLRKIDPEVILVVAYGKLLPEYILKYPPLGCINLHGSLLPAFRGAAPMQRMIMEGVKGYGVTTMYMEKGLDTGPMLEKWSTPLRDEDNFETVHDTLAREGAELLLSTLRKAQAGALHPQKQDDSKATYASKIEKSDCLLDFGESARQVHNRIRGLSPVPLSYTVLKGRTLKILSSRIEEERGRQGLPGQVLSFDSEGILIACGEGSVRILCLRPEGKSTMSAFDFCKGRGVAKGDILGK